MHCYFVWRSAKNPYTGNTHNMFQFIYSSFRWSYGKQRGNIGSKSLFNCNVWYLPALSSNSCFVLACLLLRREAIHRGLEPVVQTMTVLLVVQGTMTRQLWRLPRTTLKYSRCSGDNWCSMMYTCIHGLWQIHWYMLYSRHAQYIVIPEEKRGGECLMSVFPVVLCSQCHCHLGNVMDGPYSASPTPPPTLAE